MVVEDKTRSEGIEEDLELRQRRKGNDNDTKAKDSESKPFGGGPLKIRCSEDSFCFHDIATERTER